MKSGEWEVARALELADGQRPSVRQQILRDAAAVPLPDRRGWEVKTSEKPVATFSTWNSSAWPSSSSLAMKTSPKEITAIKEQLFRNGFKLVSRYEKGGIGEGRKAQ